MTVEKRKKLTPDPEWWYLSMFRPFQYKCWFRVTKSPKITVVSIQLVAASSVIPLSVYGWSENYLTSDRDIAAISKQTNCYENSVARTNRVDLVIDVVEVINNTDQIILLLLQGRSCTFRRWWAHIRLSPVILKLRLFRSIVTENEERLFFLMTFTLRLSRVFPYVTHGTPIRGEWCHWCTLTSVLDNPCYAHSSSRFIQALSGLSLSFRTVVPWDFEDRLKSPFCDWTQKWRDQEGSDRKNLKYCERNNIKNLCSHLSCHIMLIHCAQRWKCRGYGKKYHFRPWSSAKR